MGATPLLANAVADIIPTVSSLALGVDPGYLRFAYRVPLASDGRGPVVFLGRRNPPDATERFLVPGRRCAREKKWPHLPVLRWVCPKPGLKFGFKYSPENAKLSSP